MEYSDVTVNNCNFKQIYDAGISSQGVGHIYTIRNLRFHHNVINNCFYSFEFQGHKLSSTADGIYFENNTCLNSGSGWSATQRPDKGGAAHLKFFGGKMKFSNVLIRNNIFNESVNVCLYSEQEYSGTNTDEMWASFTPNHNCYNQSLKQNQVIRWRGGSAKGGGDYFMDDLKAYQALSGKELHTIFANPRLASKFILKSDSPAIDAGIDVGYPYSGTAPDRGAFEFIRDRNNPSAISK